MSSGNRKSRTLAVMLSALLMVCLAGWGAGRVEQQSSPPQQTPPVAAPAANPADVASIDAILRATYDTISGPAGQQREWNRFRSLFVSGARLIPIVPDSKVGFRTLVLSVEDYVKHGDTYFQKNGFFEHEVARRTERYGNMAQVFSTYESRHSSTNSKPFERGTNSFQLMNDGHRWWTVTILWQGEASDNPIPKEYLEGVK